LKKALSEEPSSAVMITNQSEFEKELSSFHLNELPFAFTRRLSLSLYMAHLFQFCDPTGKPLLKPVCDFGVIA
jgi:hypothetical protein